MLIDWFTVFAQLINFLVLAWLLKRFLYRPILRAVDSREERIAKEIADAGVLKVEAQAQQEEFRAKNADFDRQRAERMKQVTVEAKEERAQLLEAARLESQSLRHTLQAALENEQQSLKESLGVRVTEEVFAIARELLADLAGVNLEERMVEAFVGRLAELTDEQLAEVKSALHPSPEPLENPVLVKTAFALSTEQCASVKATIKQLFGTDTDVQFTIETDILSGIELSVNGRKIGWNSADYMESLARSVHSLLKGTDDDKTDKDAVDLSKAASVGHEANT